MHIGTKREAKSIANGLYRSNAKGAVVYAFTESRDPSGGVNLGEFLYASEIEKDLSFDRWDGFILLKTNELFLLDREHSYHWDAENERVTVVGEAHDV